MDKEGLVFEGIIRKLNIDNPDDKTNEKNASYNTYKTLISNITTLPPKQFVLLSTLIGILLIDDIDAKDQIILGKFINNIGQTIITAAAQEQINIKKDKWNKDLCLYNKSYFNFHCSSTLLSFHCQIYKLHN